MNLYSLSVFLFILTIIVLLYKDRRNLERSGILILRRTKKGKGLLIKISKYKKFWRFIGNIGIIVSFLASFYITFHILIGTIDIIYGVQKGGVALVIPSTSQKSVYGGFYFAIPFWHWLLAIALLAFVHEMMHGIMACISKVKIKSLGIGLLAIIPLAFVEPDEKQLEKKNIGDKLRIYAAGSFANFILAVISLLLLFFFSTSIFVADGVAFNGYISENININKSIILDSYFNYSIVKFENKTYIVFKNKSVAYPTYPAVLNQIEGVIVRIGNYTIKDVHDLLRTMEKIGCNQSTKIETLKDNKRKIYNVVLGCAPEPEIRITTIDRISIAIQQLIPIKFLKKDVKTWNDYKIAIKFWKYVMKNYTALSSIAREELEKLSLMKEKFRRPGFLGITGVHTHIRIKDEFKGFSSFFLFLNELLVLLFMINIGVGLVNLLPLKPLDGGKMWESILKTLGKEKIIDYISYIILILILINLFSNLI